MCLRLYFYEGDGRNDFTISRRGEIMAKNTVIVILTALLSISTYLLYANKNISVKLDGTETNCGADGSAQKPEDKTISETYDKMTSAQEPTKNIAAGTNTEEVEEVNSKEPEIHLDPTVGMSINNDQQIVASYKIIGPRKFSILTKNDETMVEIDLDTGRVNINPKYKLDEATTQFWRSIARKYPEVCSAE
jgi:hypothetical protein